MANKTTIQAFSGNVGAFAREYVMKIRLYVENACGNILATKNPPTTKMTYHITQNKPYITHKTLSKTKKTV